MPDAEVWTYSQQNPFVTGNLPEGFAPITPTIVTIEAAEHDPFSISNLGLSASIFLSGGLISLVVTLLITRSYTHQTVPQESELM
jgi:hypothetical protein